MGIRPFSWGHFGIVPNPPEPIECDGNFDYEYCYGCADYDECKKLEEQDYEDDDRDTLE